MKLNCACLRFASTSTRFTTMGKPASVFALWARRMQNCKNEALSFLALMSLMNIPLPIETSEKLCTSSLCEQSGRGEIKTMGVHSALRACICTASGAAMCKILQVRPLRTRIVHGNKLHISVTRWDVDCFYVEELGSIFKASSPLVLLAAVHGVGGRSCRSCRHFSPKTFPRNNIDSRSFFVPRLGNKPSPTALSETNSRESSSLLVETTGRRS